jgi:hypothetical protein
MPSGGGPPRFRGPANKNEGVDTMKIAKKMRGMDAHPLPYPSPYHAFAQARYRCLYLPRRKGDPRHLPVPEREHPAPSRRSPVSVRQCQIRLYTILTAAQRS